MTLNLLERHRLDFDEFRNGYLFSYGGGYAFTEAPNGHLTSTFPIGAGLVAAPIYGGLFVEAKLARQPLNLTDASFEDLRRHFEKEVASLLAALAVVVFFLCARRIGPTFPAVLATVAFAFGTEMWAIGSQGLWQHGPLNLCLLAMVYCSFRSLDARSPTARGAWLAGAGVCAGFLWTIRPTAIVFSIAGLAFAVAHFRRDAWPAALGLAAGMAPGVGWNAYFFGSLLGGYGFNVARYAFDPAENVRALAAVLVSPSRGLFVYTPLVIFSTLGAIGCARKRTPASRLMILLAAAAAFSILSFAFFTEWWGGFAFGPRYFTDEMAVAALLLLYVIPERPLAWMRGRPLRIVAAAAFCFSLLCSIGVQAAGAFGEPYSQWSGVPFSVDTHTERFWDFRNSQIVAAARAALRNLQPNPTLAPGYARSFRGTVLSLERFSGGPPLRLLRARPGDVVEIRVRVRNTGRSRWYGYTTGLYFGQALVRGRVIDSRGLPVLFEQYFYIPGQIDPGQDAAGIGTLTVPHSVGDYDLELDVIPHRIDQSAMPKPERRPIAVEVR